MGTNNKSRKRADDGFSAPVTGKNTGKEKKGISIPVISMILVFALFIGVFAYTKLADSGFFYRTTVSMSTENFKVDNAMMSYFFNTQYQNMAQYLQQSQVDTRINLKNQVYSGTTSWYDYIMQELTIPQVKQILVLCEAAKAAGFELSDHDKQHIDDAIQSIENYAAETAKAQGGTKMYYIRAMYGYGVNMKDIRKAMELNQLAASYSEHLTDSYTFTEADWNKYIEDEDHLKNLSVIDYISYTINATDLKKDEETADTSTTGASDTTTDTSASTSDTTGTDASASGDNAAPAEETPASDASDTTDTSASAEGAGPAPETTTGATGDDKKEEIAPEKVEAAKLADAIIQEMMAQGDAAKSREIFDAKVREYLETVVYADETDADKKKEKVDAAMEATVFESAAYDENNKFIKAVFDGEDDGLMKDAFYVDKNDTTGKYTIYMLTKKPAVEEYLTKNVRVIVLGAGTDTTTTITDTRDAILKEFESGDKTEASFTKLVETYSHDSTAHENGGLYENQGKGELGVEELNDWLFSDERKVGDYTSVSNGKTGTEEVIYIVYYTGEGMKKWHRDADNALTQEAYNADYAKLETTYKVNVSLKDLYKIPGQAGLAQ